MGMIGTTGYAGTEALPCEFAGVCGALLRAMGWLLAGAGIAATVLPEIATAGCTLPPPAVSKPELARADASSGVAAPVADCDVAAICCNCDCAGWLAAAGDGFAAAAGAGLAAPPPAGDGLAAAPAGAGFAAPAAGAGFPAGAPPPAELRAASIRRCFSSGGRLSILVARSANCCGLILRTSVTVSAVNALSAGGLLPAVFPSTGAGGALSSSPFMLSFGPSEVALLAPEPGPFV